MSDRKFSPGWHQTPQHFNLPKYDPKFPSEKIMPVVDLRPFASPVMNQGNTACGVACAYVGVLEWIQIKKARGRVPLVPLSVLYAYMLVRKAEGTWPTDSGASIIELAKVLKTGICTDKTWPFKEEEIDKNPPNIITCAAEAKGRKFSEQVFAIRTPQDAFVCLAEGYPVVGGLGIYSSWPGILKNPDDLSGKITTPKKEDEFLGGHAVGFYGYNRLDKDMTSPTMKDEVIPARTIIGKNSWGTGWGKDGWFFLPFDYFNGPDFTGEFVQIKREEV